MNDATNQLPPAAPTAAPINSNNGPADQAGITGKMPVSLSGIDPAAVGAIMTALMKPGVKTTEFWVALLAALCPMLLTWCGSLHGNAAVWAGVVVAAVYQWTRASHKTDAITLALGAVARAAALVVLCCAMLSTSGCAWLQSMQGKPAVQAGESELVTLAEQAGVSCLEQYCTSGRVDGAAIGISAGADALDYGALLLRSSEGSGTPVVSGSLSSGLASAGLPAAGAQALAGVVSVLTTAVDGTKELVATGLNQAAAAKR